MNSNEIGTLYFMGAFISYIGVIGWLFYFFMMHLIDGGLRGIRMPKKEKIIMIVGSIILGSIGLFCVIMMKRII